MHMSNAPYCRKKANKAVFGPIIIYEVLKEIYMTICMYAFLVLMYLGIYCYVYYLHDMVTESPQYLCFVFEFVSL